MQRYLLRRALSSSIKMIGWIFLVSPDMNHELHTQRVAKKQPSNYLVSTLTPFADLHHWKQWAPATSGQQGVGARPQKCGHKSQKIMDFARGQKQKFALRRFHVKRDGFRKTMESFERGESFRWSQVKVSRKYSVGGKRMKGVLSRSFIDRRCPHKIDCAGSHR